MSMAGINFGWLCSINELRSEEICNYFNITKSVMKEYISGKAELTGELILAVSESFGVSIEMLINEDLSAKKSKKSDFAFKKKKIKKPAVSMVERKGKNTVVTIKRGSEILFKITLPDYLPSDESIEKIKITLPRKKSF